MTVRQIALSAAAILQADDIQAVLTESVDASAEITDPDALALIKCVNLAVAEAISDFPVTESTEAQSRDGIIPFGELGAASSVREVRRDGKPVRFSIDDRGVKTQCDGVHTVVLTRPFEEAGADDEICVGFGADGEMLAYLTARNFCRVPGRTDEAGVWDQR
ncbi:MAG: hypothetical protein K2L54_03945, partial [Clostridiales bacterium]|nr:hypothetical protein [Clostridiales bacterium]